MAWTPTFAGATVEKMSLVILLCLGVAGTAQAANDDWKIDAMACREMTGPPGEAYRATCRSHDQYDSVLACMKALNEAGAEERMRAAGRDAVDAYMKGFPAMAGCM
ncbi:MAG TPA: hypothetical protein VKB42_22780 [Dongiaceae bacterium]|nr:hypothetical protein [Dongiaceae bacterium]